jgi:1-acyl-sn-glycerol-3-phosphate acyltransferase
VSLNKGLSTHNIFFYLVQNYLIVVLMNLTVFSLLIVMTIIGIVLSPLAYIILKIVSGLETRRIIRIFVWIYGKGWLTIIRPFTRLQTEGLKKGDIRLPCIIVPNHLSFFDTFFLGVLPFTNICFAVRSWPFKMFWYNPFMRLARYMDVEKASWEESFEACEKELRSGVALIFFPEAHRSRDGKLGRFHSGAFKVSTATGVPVIPLCITGTGKMYPPGRWFFKPAKICLKALPAVSPLEFPGPQGHMAMRKHVKALMAEQIEKMR